MKYPNVLRTLCVLCLLSLPAGASAGDPLAAARAKLAKLQMVTGEAWGFANAPGEFFMLGTVFLEKGREADFRKMLDDAKPIVRAMGVITKHQLQAMLAGR